MSINKDNIQPNSEVLVKVENLSKKFCKDLKTSLWYGVQDLFGGLTSKNHLTLRAKEFWAVKDVSFELRRGECLGLIGHNGAGKSTLLKILNGLINPDDGKVTIKGRVGALIELGAGFNPILSGRENIYNNGAVLGFSKKEIDTKLEAIIAFAELEDFIDMPVQHYSSGMKVRLGFAVAAQMEPDVLIIDEVLAVGDLGFILKCFKTIDTILPHTAVIFVSHNMPMVSRICNQIILMDHGCQQYYGNDVSKGIELYYRSFSSTERQIVFDSGQVALIDSKVYVHGQKLTHAELQWKDDLEVELILNLKNIKKLPFLLLSLYDKEQRSVAVMEVDLEKFDVDNSNEIKVVIKHNNLQLSKGKYSLNLAVFMTEDIDPLLRVHNINTIQINHYKEIWPPFFLETKCEIRGN